MGILDVFEKKECAICGKEIGLLGNRKLADGNMCKECASKLSVFFSDRKQSTVEQIKQQLAYREENAAALTHFNPTRIIDGITKLYIDEVGRRFIITRTTNYRNDNPDIISFDQVLAIDTDVCETKTEIYKEERDDKGRRVSYNPPRYNYEYTFTIEMKVNSPWFDDISFEVRDGDRAVNRFNTTYEKYQSMCDEIRFAIRPDLYPLPEKKEKAEEKKEETPKQEEVPDGKWKCTCGSVNDESALFCPKCGKKKPEEMKWFCPKCGTENHGNFCIKCGTKIPAELQKKEAPTVNVGKLSQ